MKGFLLDTNVVSYISSGDGEAKCYLDGIRGRRALVSFQTVEEIWYGAYATGWGELRTSDLGRYL